MTKSEVEVLSRSEVFRRVIDQYRQDVIGRQLWPDLAEQDESAALRTIFLEGACFDFAAALSELPVSPRRDERLRQGLAGQGRRERLRSGVCAIRAHRRRRRELR